MPRSAQELRATAEALSRNARALREASDEARERSNILRKMARTARDASAKTHAQAANSEKRRRDRVNE